MLKVLQHIIQRIVVLVIVLLTAPEIRAQHNHQERLYYFGQYRLNEQSKLSFGTGWHTMPADQWNRVELRTTHFYTINSWLQIAYGQRSNLAFEQGDLSSYELRPFQTVNLFHKAFYDSRITHRFMLEERIFFNKKQENSFHSRLRYRFEFVKPVAAVKSLYVRPMTELFYSIEGPGGALTQLKNTMALGYTVHANLKIEARYEYMLVNKGDVTPIIDNLNGYRIQFTHYF